MKAIRLLFIVILSLSMHISCSSQSGAKDENVKISDKEKVEVFYFHYSRRCATCNAVEDVTRSALLELYGSKISFAGINLDKPEGEMKAKELDVSGQTLLIVSGGTKINITNEAFMNARNNPEKLSQIIKDKIDPLL